MKIGERAGAIGEVRLAFWLACVLGGVAGCASTGGTYQAPQGGPTATLTYRLTSPIGAGSVFVFDGARCATRQHVGHLQSAPLPYQKLTNAKIDPSLSQTSITIPADKTFNSRALLDPVGNGNVTCVASFQFTPKPSGVYVAELNVRNERCEVEVFEADAAKNSRMPVEATPFKC